MMLMWTTLACFLLALKPEVSARLVTEKTLPNARFVCSDGNTIPVSYVCDGVKDCRDNLDEGHCDYGDYTTPDYYTTRDFDTTEDFDTSQWPSGNCEEPFDQVGDSCILANPVVEGNWHEARYLCQKMESELLVLDSLDFYSDVIHYIKAKELTERDYWVGANNGGFNHSYVWVNGYPTVMGTPYWALYGYSSSSYSQEPTSGPTIQERCVFFDKKRFMYLADIDCNKEEKACICQKPLSNGPRK